MRTVFCSQRQNIYINMAPPVEQLKALKVIKRSRMIHGLATILDKQPMFFHLHKSSSLSPTSQRFSDSVPRVQTFMSNDLLHWWFPRSSNHSSKGTVGEQQDKLALGSNYTGLVSWLSLYGLHSLPPPKKRKKNREQWRRQKALIVSNKIPVELKMIEREINESMAL